MPNKFKKGEFVKFTLHSTFRSGCMFGYISNYYGKNVGLQHYSITTDKGKVATYWRKSNQIQEVSKEEEMLYILENL